MLNCPQCGEPINVGALLGARTSVAKAKAARENAKKGGWPKGRKRTSEAAAVKLAQEQSKWPILEKILTGELE